MKALTNLLALAWSLAVLPGCNTPKATASGEVGPAGLRNNVYSLLHQLLEDEKNVSKLLIIKRESSELNRLIKKISAASAAAVRKLEEFGHEDRSLILKEVALPPGEVAVRNAISSTRTRELLKASGDEFELKLLLTQAEALSYGWHLAQVAARNEPHRERARYLTTLSEEMKSLYHQVVWLIAARSRPLNKTTGESAPDILSPLKPALRLGDIGKMIQAQPIVQALGHLH